MSYDSRLGVGTLGELRLAFVTETSHSVECAECTEHTEMSMFEIAAPYPGLELITVLPNPTFSDTEALTDSVSSKRAIDGTLYTYVKTKGGRRKLQWSFRLTRNKGLELRHFLLTYFASQIRVTDHNQRVWVGNLTNNPFEFVTDRKAGPAIQNWPKGETQTITLEFEGIEQ